MKHFSLNASRDLSNNMISTFDIGDAPWLANVTELFALCFIFLGFISGRNLSNNALRAVPFLPSRLRRALTDLQVFLRVLYRLNFPALSAMAMRCPTFPAMLLMA